MYNERQIARLLEKQVRLMQRIEPRMFDTVDTVSMRMYETFDKLDAAPADETLYRPVKAGDTWGDNKKYAWFKTSYTVPEALDGQDLYFCPEFGGYEAMLFVDGVPVTNYANKMLVGSHGNHYCKLFLRQAQAGTQVEMDLEAYAGHNFAGCLTTDPATDYKFPKTMGQFKICVRNELYTQFYYDYKTLYELYDAVGRNDFKGAQIERCFLQLHDVLFYAAEEVDEEQMQDSLRQAIDLMKPLLSLPNRDTCRGKIGLIGHSHMDTAWVWELDETIKKCARTYANQLNLMERYPEYRFIQSSSYHLKWMQEHYPKLFERIAERIREGRYEPNGGSWIECDCNITGGEFMIRQFLWGQRFTQKHFGYLSNAFYLPDTFGYSVAIPQILKGVGIDYFLTTKLSWNDTNRFPYETYYWEGIDGSRVFAHHNVTHCWPGPKMVSDVLKGLPQKSVSDRRLLTFGFGDGGGGPEDGMLEMARRIENLEGCPKVEYTTVGEYMQQMEADAYQPNVYRGELYLELHRGTLTGQHTIKRNNRKAEIAIRNAEYLTVADAMERDIPADSAALAPHVETLMVNQFHDILPGTSIPEVNDRSIKETTQIIKDVTALTQALLADGTPDTVTLTNTLSGARGDVIALSADRYLDADCRQQQVTLADGTRELHVSGLRLEGLQSRAFGLTDNHTAGVSPFRYGERVLETPFATVTFDENGGIASFVDRRVDRELRGSGLPLNTLLFGEDFPNLWDAWDIDADTERKLQPCTALESFDVVADGEVEFRIRTKYRLSDKTTLEQDMVFYADNPRVDFVTTVDWNDPHRLLKALFDVSVRSDYATQEIQYGNTKRPTTRNNCYQQAAFEVCNHKYTDLSEPSYGVALLNDCKYGISVDGSAMALSLHRGGAKPDPRADAGVHTFTYSFLPHEGGFCADTTVTEGYRLNHPVLVSCGKKERQPLVAVDRTNIIVEAIKPCEDTQKAFILRLYEAEGTYTKTTLCTDSRITDVTVCDMLENELAPAESVLSFRPFEIKTLKLTY